MTKAENTPVRKKKPFRKKNKQHNNKSAKQVRPVYVVDTNIILNDHTAPFTIKNADIVIPQMVVRELDKKQDFAHNKSAGYNARAFGRHLRSLMRKQKGSTIRLGNNSTIFLERTPTNINEVVVNLGLEPGKPDSLIVASAWLLKQSGKHVTVLTNDTNMWVSAVALDLSVEDYELSPETKRGGNRQMYTGVKVIELDDTTIINDIYSGRSGTISEEHYPDLHVNQILVLKGTSNYTTPSILTVFKGYNQPLEIIRFGRDGIDADLTFSGISPLNKEQAFAFQLLADESISCVTLAGKAGTGKSIVALSYAMEYLGKKAGKGKYEKVLILKPVIPVGRDIGFLPGTLDEKLEPWMRSFTDTLGVIFENGDEEYSKDDTKFKSKPYQYLLDTGLIQFQPLTFMRGRSLNNTLIILDECQNCSVHEVKTLLTRVGEGSKVICLGDVDQVDAPWLDKQNNGLTYLIEKGKDAAMIGHITLIKSQRSGLASWASDHL